MSRPVGTLGRDSQSTEAPALRESDSNQTARSVLDRALAKVEKPQSAPLSPPKRPKLRVVPPR